LIGTDISEESAASDASAGKNTHAKNRRVLELRVSLFWTILSHNPAKATDVLQEHNSLVLRAED
jgi:hypothetical protein